MAPILPQFRGHPRGRFGRKSLPKLADFSLSWAEGEVKMYRMYREIQNLDQNFSLKSWNCRETSPSLKALGWPLRNIYLLPEIPGSKSCNLATIATIIIQVLAIFAATFYCHSNLISGNNFLPQLVLATNCCRKHCTCSILLTHFPFPVNSKIGGKVGGMLVMLSISLCCFLD